MQATVTAGTAQDGSRIGHQGECGAAKAVACKVLASFGRQFLGGSPRHVDSKLDSERDPRKGDAYRWPVFASSYVVGVVKMPMNSAEFRPVALLEPGVAPRVLAANRSTTPPTRTVETTLVM